MTSAHDVNNVMAALLVNLDLVSETLSGSSAEAPLMTSATPAQRQDILTALSMAMRSCRKLAAILRAQNDEKKDAAP